MRGPKRAFRTGIFAAIIVSMILCPLMSSTIGGMPIPRAHGQVQFTPSVVTVQPQHTIQATPIVTAAPVVTPVPTLGPGQDFEQGSPHLPQVLFIESGDGNFGYGPLAGEDGMMLMWVSDETGPHYFVVGDESEMLYGSIDPETGGRRANGFMHYIEERDLVIDAITAQGIVVHDHQGQRMGYHGISVTSAGLGALACTFVTGGACIVGVLAAALGFWAKGVIENGKRQTAQAELDEMLLELDQLDVQLIGKFEQAFYLEGVP
jgi:hypothetical protein